MPKDTVIWTTLIENLRNVSSCWFGWCLCWGDHVTTILLVLKGDSDRSPDHSSSYLTTSPRSAQTINRKDHVIVVANLKIEHLEIQSILNLHVSNPSGCKPVQTPIELNNSLRPSCSFAKVQFYSKPSWWSWMFTRATKYCEVDAAPNLLNRIATKAHRSCSAASPVCFEGCTTSSGPDNEKAKAAKVL